MSTWDEYPSNYREREVERIVRATQAGDCASVVGLSGAGKSNLMGFLTHRVSSEKLPMVLVDCNRLNERSSTELFRSIRRAISTAENVQTPEGSQPTNDHDDFDALNVSVGKFLQKRERLVLLLDRFDSFSNETHRNLFNQLRSLRDLHKFKLTYVVATRHILTEHTELSELFYAHTIWLGCLSASDAHWNVSRFAKRRGEIWSESDANALIQLSRGYPSLLKAACEAFASSGDLASIAEHPAIQKRVEEFWADSPSKDEIEKSGLKDHTWLMSNRAPTFDTSQLTAKEHLLLKYLQTHPDTVCEKDDLIRAVYPEDKIFTKGVRDDSLAQLVRRLREKIEPDPSNPKHILAVPGRGYKFVAH
jgi:hypothetical protein